MKISVIVTVLNESSSIQRLLESLAGQSRPPDEIVVVDGGSTDGTVLALRTWASASRLPVRIVERPGANISEGRNAAIAAAAGEIIASTDAGVRLEPGWLEALVAPFEGEEGPHVRVVSGWFVADPETLFETAMGATVLPRRSEVKGDTFLPSSRSVAFRKAAWAAAGGYPEWLDYCEDLVYDLKLRELYGPFPFEPMAKVHFRPRGSLRAFWRQYYRYARGDGKADLWRRRHAIRYMTYLALLPGLAALALHHSPLWWPALALGAAAYTATPYRHLWSSVADYSWPDRIKAALLVPVIRVVGDCAKMVGYPVGRLWRWRNRRRAEIHWR